MSIAEKLVTIAENQHKVYRAGQRSMVDEDKIIEKTVSGGSSVIINDLSEIPHTVSVSLSAPLVPQFGGILEGGYFEDTDFSFVRSSVFEVPERGIYTFALNARDKSKCEIGDTFYGDIDWDGTTLPGFFEFVNDHTIRAELYAGKYRIFISDYYGLKAKDILSATLEMGTDVTLPEQASPDLSGVEVRVKGEDSEQIYFADEKGFAEVKSLSPKMEISTENEDISITATYHQAYGIKLGWDNFWDVYQQNGELTVCDCAFAGRGWTDQLFNPKYKMTPTSAYMMFRYSEITKDVSQWVDLSKSTNNAYCFYGTKLKSIQADFSSATGLVSTFGYTAETETISIKLSNAGVKLTDCFTAMKGLKNLTIEGVISEGNINIASSTLLTVESAKSLITALKDISGTDKAYTYKVTFAPATKTLLDAEGATAPNGDTWLNYVFAKGWNR